MADERARMAHDLIEGAGDLQSVARFPQRWDRFGIEAAFVPLGEQS